MEIPYLFRVLLTETTYRIAMRHTHSWARSLAAAETTQRGSNLERGEFRSGRYTSLTTAGRGNTRIRISTGLTRQRVDLANVGQQSRLFRPAHAAAQSHETHHAKDQGC